MTTTDDLIEHIKRNDANAVAALLDGDRSLLKAKSGETTAILLALYYGHPEIAQLFTDRGAELSFPEACAVGNRERVRTMVKGDKALANSYSGDGFPAVGLSIFFRHPEIARDLIEAGADVNGAARNPQRVAPVHSAATVQDHATMRLLLERGADPNARQQMGYTALHSAASRGDIEMAKLLLDHGADPKAKADDGQDCVKIAESHNQNAFAEWFRMSFRA